MSISGRLLADVRRCPLRCSGLLEVDRIEARGVEGRPELQLPDCSAPLLQGWRVQATGVLRRPLVAAHPLLQGSAKVWPVKAVGDSCGSRASKSCRVHRRRWLICDAMLLNGCNRPPGLRLPLATMVLQLFLCLA